MNVVRNADTPPMKILRQMTKHTEFFIVQKTTVNRGQGKMILTNKKQSKEIEYHFINYENDTIAIKELTEEIAEHYNFTPKVTGIHSNVVSNEKVLQQIEEIQTTTDKLQKWVMVVKATKGYFAKTIHSEFIKLYYENRKTVAEIANELYVSKESVYKYRQDVLNFSAVKANEYELIKV